MLCFYCCVDREGDSCDKPETDWDREKDEEEFVFTKYAEGSLVWARMAGYPWSVCSQNRHNY